MSFPNRSKDEISQNYTLEKYRNRCLLYALVILVIGLLGWWLLSYFGVDCRVTSDGEVQQISIKVTPAQAEQYLKRMYTLSVPAISMQDICLDNGSMVCAFITRDEAELVAERKTPQMVTTRWDLQCLKEPLVYEDLNLLVSFGEFNRLELNSLVNEAKRNEEAFCVVRTNVEIAPERVVDYRVPTSMLNGYVLRAHRIGASRIIIPFFWNLDNKTPAKVYLPPSVY